MVLTGQLTLTIALMLTLLFMILTKYYRKFLKFKQFFYIFPKLIFLFNSISILCLSYSYITSDFSVINIYKNSQSTVPLLYKISGLWGNHEGSMLLWCWIQNLYMFLYILFNKNNNYYFNLEVIKTLNLISCFFLFFTIFTSNPFLQTNFFKFDGEELNPILQDPGLAIHPPILYLGYIGGSVVFSLLIAYLKFDSKKDIQILPELKKWTYISWSFLTLGISLGSWWAYHELGWGGWWFWDPVENASLMPWIIGIMLIHSLKILSSNKLGIEYWTIFSGILIYLSSIVGTFFVRSGLLNSVHSFASDSTRGFFIFLFIVYSTYLSFKLLKQHRNINSSTYQVYSRNFYIVLSNIILTSIFITVVVGTFSPILFKFLLNKDVSIGPPFFNEIITPLTFGLLILMIISPYVAYSKKSNYNIRFKKFINPFFLLGIIFTLVILVFYLYEIDTPITPFILITISIIGILQIVFNILKTKKILPMDFSHLGVMIFIISAVVSSYFRTESIQLLKPGDHISLNKYIYIFRDVNYLKSSNFNSLYGNFIVLNPETGEKIANFFPEKRYYPYQGTYTTKSSIVSNYYSDLYAMIGDGNIKNGWYVRLVHTPMMPYIWVSSLLIISGGLLAYRKIKHIDQK